MKKITFAMTFVCVSLVLTILIIGFNVSNQNKIYRQLENDFVEAASIYRQYSEIQSSNKITLAELIKAGYMEKLVTSDGKDECVGYVEKVSVVNNEYKAFIKCDKYTTEGYKNAQ